MKTYEELRAEWDAREAEDKAYLAELGIEWPRCGFWVGKGWRPLVHETLVKLIAEGWDRQLSQVKQKFGLLRIYLGAHSHTVVLDDILREAERLSGEICEGCGLEREVKGQISGRAHCNACKALPFVP